MIIKDFELYEISLVATPANPDCRVIAVGGRVEDRE